MTDETTSEQLAEIDRDMADIERQVAELVEESQRADYKTQELPDETQELETKTQELPEYTPPEGWRVLAVGERLRDGDVTVRRDGYQYPTERVGYFVGSNQRYIRPIEAEPQPEPQPEAEPVLVREGRWRTRNGLVKDVTAMPTDHEDYAAAYPWWDGVSTWRNDGRWLAGGSTMDLMTYLGPIEPEPEPQPESDTELQAQVAFLKGREVTLGTRLQQEREVTTRLRGELELVQNLLGTEKRRVTELEELVASLRTINRGCENAVRDAGKENTALRNQLAAVKAELASVAADRQQLRVELDAAQQVPADSPELLKLRAHLEQVTLGRDMYQDGYSRVLSDLETIRETTKAAAVETIAEWLEPIRLVDSAYLANATMQHLPQIMRTLTGLDSHAID